MDKQIESNKRIAHNTMILYTRMLFTVGISFYTSRVILTSLGVSDYGLYNVIGGVIMMFYMITSTMSGAISRYLTFELGKNNIKKQISTFYTSINLMILLSFGIIAIGETIGLWFIQNKLTIPSDRIYAANWIYQLTLIAFVVEMINVPFQASVISHEKMKAFAWVTIVNVVMKLLVALSLSYSPIDKLVFYAILMMLLSISTQFMYWIYCKRKFKECKYKISIDKTIYKGMFNFAGWSFMASVAELLSGQGVNIMLNIFFGTPINAARGVAMQVDSTVKAFTNNFMLAIRPQITKSYAQGNIEYTKILVYKSSLFSFLLLYIFSLPISLETHYLLNIWLTEVPSYTSIFIQLTLILTLINVIIFPFQELNNATGDIKKFQFIKGIGQLLVLPIAYLLLIWGAQPYTVVIVAIVCNLITLPSRVNVNAKHLSISWKEFCKKVIFKLFIIISITLILSVPLIFIMKSSLIRFITVGGVCFISTSILTFYIALTHHERVVIKNFINNKYLQYK